MSVPEQLRASARLVAVLCLVGLCGGGAMARTAPQIQTATLSPANIVAPIAIAPFVVPPIAVAPLAPPSARRDPFGLAVSSEGPLAARWHTLQSGFRAEAHVLALCRSNPKICPPAAARFLAIIETGRARSGRARLGEINRAVNLAIRPMSDLVQYGATDVWATPLMTFTSGAGDCEDYAIAKFVALRQAGMAAHDLRLVIVHDRQTGEDHAVTAARLDGQWLILDNRTMMLRVDNDELFLTPLVALGGGDEARPPVMAMTPKPYRETGLTPASRG